MFLAGRHERLEGPLHDALRADVDPRAGGHLPKHHQPAAIEFVEMLPGGPMRDEVRVGQQDAWGVGVGLEDADRLARLDQQCLVVLQAAQRGDDGVEARPIRAARPMPP